MPSSWRVGEMICRAQYAEKVVRREESAATPTPPAKAKGGESILPRVPTVGPAAQAQFTTPSCPVDLRAASIIPSVHDQLFGVSCYTSGCDVSFCHHHLTTRVRSDAFETVRSSRVSTPHDRLDAELRFTLGTSARWHIVIPVAGHPCRQALGTWDYIAPASSNFLAQAPCLMDTSELTLIYHHLIYSLARLKSRPSDRHDRFIRQLQLLADCDFCFSSSSPATHQQGPSGGPVLPPPSGEISRQ